VVTEKLVRPENVEVSGGLGNQLGLRRSATPASIERSYWMQRPPATSTNPRSAVRGAGMVGATLKLRGHPEQLLRIGTHRKEAAAQ
jgi:hypothetical protein